MNTPHEESTYFDLALNKARQILYRFGAIALCDPQIGSWDDLDALRSDPLLKEAAALVQSESRANGLLLGPGELPLERLEPMSVLGRLPSSARELTAAYQQTFGLLVSGVCPPYETEYIDSKFAFQRSNTLADINGYYAAFGLTVSNLHPERSDHIALELEFMATLLGLERHAAITCQACTPERLKVCRDAQSRFLGEHLAWWVPAFARLLQAEDACGFYGSTGAFLAALIPAERAILGVCRRHDDIMPSRLESAEACAGCQFSA